MQRRHWFFWLSPACCAKERRQPKASPGPTRSTPPCALFERLRAGERMEPPPLAPEVQGPFELLMREFDRMPRRLADPQKPT